MLDFKRECENYSVCESVGVLTFHLMRLLSQMEEFFEKPKEFPDKKTVLDFYFALRNFIHIYDLVDENYVIYNELQEDGRFMIKLFCVDPSKNLQKCIDLQQGDFQSLPEQYTYMVFHMPDQGT